MMKFVKLSASLFVIAGLSGCFNLLPDPEPANSIYRLTSSLEKSTPNIEAPIVRVDTPTAARLVATRKIIVSPDAQRLAVAGGAEWADSLPKMVQQNFVDILASEPNVIGVIPRVATKADYRIHIHIDNFEARFDNGPENAPLIIVSYTAAFAKAASRDLLGTQQVSHTQRADSATVSAIVSAMDIANKGALAEIANWLSTRDMKT